MPEAYATDPPTPGPCFGIGLCVSGHPTAGGGWGAGPGQAPGATWHLEGRPTLP